ncbi:MAG: AAA family ATPase [Deltaproteobacteria bacterium]|nr:AAA family ATPase [Deltaproteobacteria bacterium]MBW1874343.1 AAA family ATPase [Deltaproteobacteria bacterium]MBW2210893.1 AAA family ATPase [Deltaproteobacteria bacterium]MBW2213229.1 AAA family ATPase [Deltaproteobacteria bacterium]MBW2378564.1 AAA family ATPase [Deltaproteobacteria bacterium]
MIELPDDCRLAFCVGVGGVGKTTFAAALALREALRGRSVLVLTADPARRLADALGIYGLRDTPSDIPLPSHAPGGELHAAMLETKASADEIIRHAANDAGRAQRVLDNRIYQAFSNTLARSHAYAAMERVHDAVHDSRYDLVVVDTPPAQSSIEILDAPARLVSFLDQRVVRWFLQASDDSPGLRGGAMAQRLLRAVAGASLVSALTEFLTEMAFLREGFAERAREVRDLMRSSSARFVLVSSADTVGIEAAKSVAAEIASRDLELAHVVFNRAFVPEVGRAAHAPVTYPDSLAALAPKLEQMRAILTQEEQQKRSNMVAFCREQEVPAWSLPEATRPLADSSALAAWIDQGRQVEPFA